MTNYSSFYAWLQAALPSTNIEYGYPKIAKAPSGGSGRLEIAYQKMSSTVNPAVGQRIKSVAETYLVVIQASSAKTCIQKTDALISATEQTNVQFMSDSLSCDTSKETRWTSSLIFSFYKA